MAEKNFNQDSKTSMKTVKEGAMKALKKYLQEMQKAKKENEPFENLSKKELDERIELFVEAIQGSRSFIEDDYMLDVIRFVAKHKKVQESLVLRYKDWLQKTEDDLTEHEQSDQNEKVYNELHRKIQAGPEGLELTDKEWGIIARCVNNTDLPLIYEKRGLTW